MCVFNSLTNAQNKYALLIGVSKYPANDSKKQFWGNLSSDKDLELLRKTLPKQGFLSEHIFSLENENVTPIGVGKAVENLCQQIVPGDIVVFHFSGHGQQITDIDGAEYDGFDEAFVCYNAPTEYYDGYKGEDHLTDDQINVLLSKIREKLGSNGHLLVLFDSCHSGNMSRGGNELTRRGGEGEIVIPTELIKTLNHEKVSEGYSDWLNAADERADLAPFCAISGCLSGEVNYQISDKANVQYGSLTYAFCEVIKQPGIEKMNYQDVSLKIKQIIQNKVSEHRITQHPSTEGNLGSLFLSGKALGIKPYFEIFSIEKDKITVEAGLLNNLNVGDSLSFKNNSGKVVAKGGIQSITATQCIVKCEKIQSQWTKVAESNYTAEVWNRNLTAEFIPIFIKSSSKKHLAAIKDSLSTIYGYKLIEDSLKAKLIFNVGKDKALSCYLRKRPNVFIRKIQNKPYETYSDVKKELEAYFLIERFANLELSSDLNTSVSFRRFSPKVLIQNEIDTFEIITSNQKKYFTHPLKWENEVIGKMKNGDLIQMETSSSKSVHAVMVNIVNGEITNLEGLKARNIKPNNPHSFWSTVEPGDLYKIIISDKPFDLTKAPAVIQGKSNLSRGSDSAIEILFPKTNATRGGEQEFSIYNFFVEIE